MASQDSILEDIEAAPQPQPKVSIKPKEALPDLKMSMFDQPPSQVELAELNRQR